MIFKNLDITKHREVGKSSICPATEEETQKGAVLHQNYE